MNYISPGLNAIGRYIKEMGSVPPVLGSALKQAVDGEWADGQDRKPDGRKAGRRDAVAQDKVCVIGAGAMVGSGLMRALAHCGSDDIVGTFSHDAPYFGPVDGVRLERLDLRDGAEVRRFFLDERPSRVFLASTAARGGEAAERSPATYLMEQLEYQAAVMKSAFEAGVERLIIIASSCVYPGSGNAPLREEDLLNGPPDPRDEVFALARIAGLKLCQYYNHQYGTCFMGILPTNVYGPGDNFTPGMSQVLPAVLHRLHEARHNRLQSVTFRGSCRLQGDYMHVDDLAHACTFLMNVPDEMLRMQRYGAVNPCLFNAGSDRAATLLELAGIAARVVGFEGRLVFDASRRKCPGCRRLDVSRLKRLGWSPRVDLEDGVRETYAWYLDNEVRAFWY